MAHHGRTPRLVTRQQPRQREVDDRLGHHLAELVVHEVDERAFLEGAHARRVARPRRGHRNGLHVDPAPRPGEELLRLGIRRRAAAQRPDAVRRHVEARMRLRGEALHEFVARRGGEAPRGVRDDKFARCGALRSPLPGEGRHPPPVAARRERTVKRPDGPRLFAGEGLRGRELRRRGEFDPVTRHVVTARGPEQRRRVLRHGDSAGGLHPLPVAGPQRLFVEELFGRKPLPFRRRSCGGGASTGRMPRFGRELCRDGCGGQQHGGQDDDSVHDRVFLWKSSRSEQRLLSTSGRAQKAMPTI